VTSVGLPVRVDRQKIAELFGSAEENAAIRAKKLRAAKMLHDNCPEFPPKPGIRGSRRRRQVNGIVCSGRFFTLLRRIDRLTSPRTTADRTGCCSAPHQPLSSHGRGALDACRAFAAVTTRRVKTGDVTMCQPCAAELAPKAGFVR
jgi:hypothetical protein